MRVLVTYDVSTLSREGQRRLRRVARVCEDFGQRVQKSVFECSLDEKQFVVFRSRLLDEVDLEEDSVRLYRLSGVFREMVEHHGRDSSVDFDGPLIV